jgi:acyl-CoA-binding protein
MAMATSLPEDFAAAQIRVKALAKTPAPDELLALYGLYKQATAGDATGSAPGMFDFKARAKHDAWARRAGMSPEAAMGAYVELVATLAGKYGAA